MSAIRLSGRHGNVETRESSIRAMALTRNFAITI